MDHQDVRKAAYSVVDVETTGLDPTSGGVVEVACLRVERGVVVDRFASLVHPGRDIPACASAVHGIYDRDVFDAPPIEALRARLLMLTAGSAVVAHNARFDLGFLPFLSARPVICSMRLALHLVDASTYRNDALRQLLGITMPPGHGPNHRALADAEVTAAVLAELLHRYAMGPFPQSIPGMIATIAKPARLGRFAFGVHRGTPVGAIPTSYLRWILAEGFDDWPDVRATADYELQRRAASKSA